MLRTTKNGSSARMTTEVRANARLETPNQSRARRTSQSVSDVSESTMKVIAMAISSAIQKTPPAP
jgi:hypothetical protein